MDDQQSLERSFGEVHFGSAELGDVRRTRRLAQVADQMVKHPGGTLPEKFSDPASLKGLYRLAARDEVTHEAVLARRGNGPCDWRPRRWAPSSTFMTARSATTAGCTR